MDPQTKYNWFFVLISVVIGLALTEILTCVAHLFLVRHRTRPYWLHIVWLVMVFMYTAEYWYAAGLWFGKADLTSTFPKYLLTLSVPVAIYLAAAVIAPKAPPDAEVFDLRAYYYANHRSLFLLFAATIVLLAVQRTLATGKPWLRDSNLVRACGVAVLVSLAVWKDPRYHAAMTLALLLLFAGFILAF